MARKPNGDYDVGFGKPPQHSRFRAGQSGNSKGRPKGSKNLETLLTEALDEKVVVKEEGRRRAITKREVVIKQLVNKSAGADLQAIRMLLGIMQGFQSAAAAAENSEAADQPLSEADRQVMEELSRRLLRSKVGGDA